jgi:hypothetical protein
VVQKSSSHPDGGLQGNFNRFGGTATASKIGWAGWRGQPSPPVTDFPATLRITLVVDGDRAFVEWWAIFDCDPDRRDELTGALQGWFGKWLELLRATMTRPAGFPAEQAETRA